MNATVLFDTPQREISSLINAKLSACQNASIVAGFLTPSGDSDKAFDIADTPWHKDSDEGWKLVTGLKHPEGSPMEKDARALELAKPGSGSFILVSLRRRLKIQTARQEQS